MKIQFDKVKHFVVNVLGVLGLFFLGHFLGCIDFINIIVATIFMICVSIWKEKSDSFFSYPDLCADYLGIISALLIIITYIT